MMIASSLPSLARLGLFKSANDAKSRFIHKHIRAATALSHTSSSPEVGEGMGMPEPLPRHWGGPPEFPRAKVAAPVAVMATEAALEDYRQRRRAERIRDHRSLGSRSKSQGPGPEGVKSLTSVVPKASARGARLQRGRSEDSFVVGKKTNHCEHPSPRHPHQHLRHHPHPCQRGGHNSDQRQPKHRPPSTHAVILPKGGGLVLIGEDGVRKSKFPRGCELSAAAMASVATTPPLESKSSGESEDDDVLARLCNPKHFTGTAATGHLPVVVDLEGGVGVLLKGASIAVKDHIGKQEVSWRLRLAERL
ncbi:hypothetical protein Esi_0057_0107 [Ectocarpus siliculosus]|uniref:Uncharacterized protein n=1 Tax=Ectocarpus siliculosus TaxID=2880 RepID=D7G4L8_ECTSI|nr:hypothetical protein Esi_0057_0107 [Ectocarpus siliculosus]|eukprot:CBJ48921.1 hypothetical protein Esi_0057_0107 [Ectocarpus siliculosus]